MRPISPLAFLALAVLAATAQAAPKSRIVDYKQDTTALEGYLVTAGGGKAKRPGVILFPDWMGVTESARKEAERVAKMGYVVFVADIYGKGKNPKDSKEAGPLAGAYKSNRPLMRQRAEAGFAQLKAAPGVDTTRLGAMGFCFGGTVALELARAGADLDGTVSIHGNLDTPDPSQAKNIKGAVLVLHGADDPYVPAQQVQNFQEEMRAAKVDWHMVSYGGAVHAFTKPEAGDDPAQGQAYHPKAAERAFEALRDFYAEVLGARVAGR
jgi:dienelactone hydrolase